MNGPTLDGDKISLSVSYHYRSKTNLTLFSLTDGLVSLRKKICQSSGVEHSLLRKLLCWTLMWFYVIFLSLLVWSSLLLIPFMCGMNLWRSMDYNVIVSMNKVCCKRNFKEKFFVMISISVCIDIRIMGLSSWFNNHSIPSKERWYTWWEEHEVLV